MAVQSEEFEISFKSNDGTSLDGTILRREDARADVVLVHGGGVTREEGGFFTRIARGLAEYGFSSIRFDLRGHGTSGGSQVDMTLTALMNDLDSAAHVLREETSDVPLHILGASFGGGIVSTYAGRHTDSVRSIILINPLLNYKKRLVDDKPYWEEGRISDEKGAQLAAEGYVSHSPTMKLGRPILNEVFYIRPDELVQHLTVPTLIVHGTHDTFIPIESSRLAASRIPGEVRLYELVGAQHGVAVHDDPQYADPQTQKWQSEVIDLIGGWVTQRT